MSGNKREIDDKSSALKITEDASTEGSVPRLDEPPCKKANLLKPRDESRSPNVSSHGAQRAFDSAANKLSQTPLGTRMDKLLLMLKENQLNELEIELTRIRSEAESQKEGFKSLDSQKQHQRIFELEEKLMLANSSAKMVKKENELLRLGFQKDGSAFLRWVDYLERLPEFDTPHKLYKAYLEASIQAAATQAPQSEPIKQTERYFNIISDDLDNFYRQIVSSNQVLIEKRAMVANKTIETNSLEKPTKECQEMLQTLRRAMLLLVKKLLKEKDELQQNLSPLDIEAYDKSELAKELIKWKTKAETLDETLRNAAMDYHFELPYRILQLKDNPASVDLRIKKSHLDRLRLENNRLLKLTQGIPSLKGLVPAESLENALKEIEELRAEKESNEEKTSRLNGVLRAKTLDFKRTIVSVLGYDIEVLGSTLVKIRPQGQPYHFILKFTNDVDKSLANFQIQGDADMDMITPLRNMYLRKYGSMPGFLSALTLRNNEERWDQILQDSFNLANQR